MTKKTHNRTFWRKLPNSTNVPEDLEKVLGSRLFLNNRVIVFTGKANAALKNTFLPLITQLSKLGSQMEEIDEDCQNISAQTCQKVLDRVGLDFAKVCKCSWVIEPSCPVR
jgi:hypothetical protein